MSSTFSYPIKTLLAGKFHSPEDSTPQLVSSNDQPDRCRPNSSFDYIHSTVRRHRDHSERSAARSRSLDTPSLRRTLSDSETYCGNQSSSYTHPVEPRCSDSYPSRRLSVQDSSFDLLQNSVPPALYPESNDIEPEDLFFRADPVGEIIASSKPIVIESHPVLEENSDADDASAADTMPSLPFNPSEYGIVHLPPLISSPASSVQGASASSKSYRSHRSNCALSQVSFSSNEGQNKAGLYGPRRPDSSKSDLNSNKSNQNSACGSSMDFSIDHFVAFRYDHAQDEHGNHVIIGREGNLHHCGDEPIRTPGAVQAFGVLIVVSEAEDALVVRQVSENSTQLLGLPPHYLFSLECFTDTLPAAQAGLLWDNIQFLRDFDDTEENDEDETQHVFLLSGWAAPDNPSDSEHKRKTWTCWCAMHRPPSLDGTSSNSSLIILEFELERDTVNPLYPIVAYKSLSSPSHLVSPAGSCDTVTPSFEPRSRSNGPSSPGARTMLPTDDDLHVSLRNSTHLVADTGLDEEEGWLPSTEDIIESTTSRSKPIPALERLRRMSKPHHATTAAAGAQSKRRRKMPQNEHVGVGIMDIFAVMSQINEQLGASEDLDAFFKVVVGLIKDLTQFHRVLVYQFDELWNGEAVAELVDWNHTHDLYKGLHFPASDIPPQARALYAINKVRLLYDRSQPAARIVVRSEEDLDPPLNMTHCYLRAMSPIHIKYLTNMGVRASMSVSIMAFGSLWGLIACHSYGIHGMRVSFPVRQMLRLLSQSISRNLERLYYAQRLHTRKLSITTMTSDRRPHSPEYLISNADDLLELVDADYGILVIGECAKILGPNQHGQEILIMAEYLRLKQFNTIQASQAVIRDYEDLYLTSGLEVIAGMLYVPLSSEGRDFIAFLRKGQSRQVKWAGKPYKDGAEENGVLEPRQSFKVWSEQVAGRCRKWTDVQIETVSVLALVYSRFIDVWRQKQNAIPTTSLTNILLSNASHEVRTPLNHIINYLEMALNGPLDEETRELLCRSHTASKGLLFTINDLLDLTRLESGQETSFNDPFDLHSAIEDAIRLYRKEAERRGIEFVLDLEGSPKFVVGDAKKIRTVVQNLTANALKYTTTGSIAVCCRTFGEPEGLRGPRHTAVEIVVADTGCGIRAEQLENIFREFEQVDYPDSKVHSRRGVGLGLAVVARIVEQLEGQLRVDSKPDEGSRFSFLIPLALFAEGSSSSSSVSSRSSMRSLLSTHRMLRSRTHSSMSTGESESPAESLTSNRSSSRATGPNAWAVRTLSAGHLPGIAKFFQSSPKSSPMTQIVVLNASDAKLRILIVEDNEINRIILSKRLRVDGCMVVDTTNGQEALAVLQNDRTFDAVLMDIQMPIMDGFETTRRIRASEEEHPTQSQLSPVSHQLNGRIPVFAVSASLTASQRKELQQHGFDGWILKPIDFKRLNIILKGLLDSNERRNNIYGPKCHWEAGGWLS